MFPFYVLQFALQLVAEVGLTNNSMETFPFKKIITVIFNTLDCQNVVVEGNVLTPFLEIAENLGRNFRMFSTKYCHFLN